MGRDSKRITQFYLPPTHGAYLPLTFTPQPQGITARQGCQAELTWVTGYILR